MTGDDEIIWTYDSEGLFIVFSFHNSSEEASEGLAYLHLISLPMQCGGLRLPSKFAF